MMNSKQLARLFRQAVPPQAIISAPTSLRVYESDGLSAYRQPPRLVVLPTSIAQVQGVLALCQKHAIPVVSRGAGTSLSGGALPHKDGIVVSLARMNKMLAIDPLNRIATVQAGMCNSAISAEVESLGLYYAPDPSSQIACTIGGNVAENAGGVHCLKYGLTLHNVTSVKVATIEGELLDIGGNRQADGTGNRPGNRPGNHPDNHLGNCLDWPGFDLLSLMIGSEGMLCIVVEVTVKLLPIPECAKVVMGVFDSIKNAGDSVAAIIGNGIIPAGIEMMDNPAIRAAEDFVGAGYPVTASAILLCELDGTEAEVDEQIRQVDGLFRDNGAIDTRLAKDDQERALFWSGRKAAFPAMGRISPDYYCIDGTIPRRALGYVLTEINKLAKQYQLRVANVFHAGDGNLHPLILYDANIAGELSKTEALGSKILQLCIDVGGTITGEHGVGVEKIGEMCIQFSEQEREQFHRIRQCFDPKSLLNPGKAIPTLARCAEHNAMHVHHGDLPFPHLERF